MPELSDGRIVLLWLIAIAGVISCALMLRVMLETLLAT